MLDKTQYLQDIIERDYIENKALLKVLRDNKEYGVANWLISEIHDNKKTRIMMAKFLDLLDEYQKECNN